MIVGVDLDDTFLDTYSFRKRTNTLDRSNTSDERFTELLKRYKKDLKPREYSLEYTEKMYELSKNKIIFVTARPAIMYNVTKQHLDYIIKNKFPYKLYVVGDKPKSETLKKEYITHFVDDHPHFILDAFKHVKRAFLIRSENIKKDPNFGRIRNITIVNDLKEMYEILNKRNI